MHGLLAGRNLQQPRYVGRRHGLLDLEHAEHSPSSFGSAPPGNKPLEISSRSTR
jgi:hypothetical protein